MAATLEDLLAERARRAESTTVSVEPQPPNVPHGTASLEDLLAEKARRQQAEAPQSWPRLLAEAAAKGIVKVGDLLPFSGLMNAEYPFRNPETGQKEISRVYPSMTNEILPAVGVDINTQRADTLPKKMVAGAIEEAPTAILGGIKGIPKGAASLAATGAGSKLLQEFGVPELPANIASGLGVSGASAIGRFGKGMVKTLKNIVPNRAQGEEEVGRILNKYMSEAERKAAIEALEAAQPYPVTGYESSVAGETGAPTLGKLHRSQKQLLGAGSKLAEQEEANARKLTEGFKERSGSLSPSHQGENIRTKLEAENKRFRTSRREVTHEGYEGYKKVEDQLPAKPLRTWFKDNKNVGGKLSDDLNFIKKETAPVGGTYRADIKRWEAAAAKERAKHARLGPKNRETAYNEWLKDNPRPQQVTSVARLIEADKAITARIDELPAKSARAAFLRKGQKAVQESLEERPDYFAHKKLYAEKSIPINELENPSLRAIFEKDGNHYKLSDTGVMNAIFKKHGHRNIESLRKALGPDSPIMKDIEEAAFSHYYRSITNAGSAGGGRVLSFDKMRKMDPEFRRGIDKLLSNEQKQFLNEVERALESKQMADTINPAHGSPTSGNLGTGKRLRREFKLEHEPFWSIKGQTMRLFRKYIPSLSPWLKDALKQRADILSDLTGEVLADKALAHKILTAAQKGNPNEFNKFMEDLVRTGIPATRSSQEEKDHDDVHNNLRRSNANRS